jgi:hypothetical protein
MRSERVDRGFELALATVVLQPCKGYRGAHESVQHDSPGAYEMPGLALGSSSSLSRFAHFLSLRR